MIAKILKSTSGFSGILYSELKVNEGKATFCGAFNFPFSENNVHPDTYIGYLESLADTNPTIKNRQFHAVISTKGQEHDQAFLTDIAQKWMEKMGYGKQPYLIYFHGDTDNNHVHIISCRIDENGERINPYMEGRRAGIAIRELMNENLSEKAKAYIADILSNYSYSTIAQFKLAVERRGWKTSEKNGNINLIKFISQGNVAIDDVMAKAKEYEQDKIRISQLRAVFNKYKGLPIAEFQKFMHEKFGVDVVFHTAKGHDQPYGYTVIDHNRKIIMKGSEIMPLETLTRKLNIDEHKRLAKDIIESLLSRSDRPLYSELKNTLYRNGYSIKKNIVSVFGDDQTLIKIPEDIYKRLLYNDRLKSANKFVVHNPDEALALSKLFFVRAADIKVQPGISRDDSAIRNVVANFVNDKERLNAYLESHNMKLVSLTNNTYIIYMQNNVIADVSGLGLERGINLDLHYEKYSSIVDSIEDFALGAFFALTGSIGHISDGRTTRERDDDNERRRKRRKKRSI
jgi:hypothetical protein